MNRNMWDHAPNNEAVQKAVAQQDYAHRPNALMACLMFSWRTILKIRYVPEQLFDVTLFPIMFTLMFTYLFGGAIAGSTGDYLHYLLPGILVQTVIFTTVYTGVTLNTDITKGVFDRFRSLPIWSPSVIVGALLGDMLRYLLASSTIIILGLLLGFRPGGGVTGVLSAVLLLLVFAFSISWVFTALGLVMRTPNAVMGLGMTVLFPLTFASNIFVDPGTMPVWLQKFVHVNPITILATAERGLMHGNGSLLEVGMALMISALFVLLFAPLTMALYRVKS